MENGKEEDKEEGTRRKDYASEAARVGVCGGGARKEASSTRKEKRKGGMEKRKMIERAEFGEDGEMVISCSCGGAKLWSVECGF